MAEHPAIDSDSPSGTIVPDRSGSAAAAPLEPSPSDARATFSAAAWRGTPALAGVLATVATLLALLLLRWCGALETLELLAYDRLVLLRSQGPGMERRVVQIGVSEADIERFGWPLPDGVLADLIDRLHAAGPQAIGIDIFRPSPIAPGTEALERVLADAPEVVWVDRFSEGTWDGVAAPAMVEAAGRNGFGDLLLDRGGVSRRALLYVNDERHWQEAFSLKLAFLYLEHHGVMPAADPDNALRLGAVSLPPLERDLGGYAEADTRGYQILREFRAPARLPSFSLGGLLDGTVPRDALEGRIAVVGVTADSVRDDVATALSMLGQRPLAGLTVHGLLAAQLVAHGLDGLAPTRPPARPIESALIALAVLAGGLAGTFLRSARQLVAASVGGGAALLGASWLAFLNGLWLPVLPLAGGWVLSGVIAAAGSAHAERARRAELMRLFSAQLSAPVAEELWRRRKEMVARGQLVPMRLEATVLFADINDFTAISEQLEPETIVRWLNPYMEAMSRLVEEHGGIVERLAGDAIMAMFGVPIARRGPPEVQADALAAVRYACRMTDAVRELNASYRREGLPEIRVGIGIHSGVLVGCCLGGPERQQYATIGDSANTAARLMTVAKELMKHPGTDEVCRIVLSESTRILLRGVFELRPLGPVALKGKRLPLECYAVEPGGAGA